MQEKSPSLLRLSACLLYEGLAIIAIALLGTAVLTLLLGNAFPIWALQLFLWGLLGMYFVICWHRVGQTLAMKTWGVQLQYAGMAGLPLKVAFLRYLFATVSVFFGGLGFVWAFKSQHLFLHDAWLRKGGHDVRFVRVA